jgi:hypothetical protein
MSDTAKSFDEVLADAPMAPSADTVTLTGALARSPEVGKFVLTLMDGRAVVLDISAVKSHTVLGGSVGQKLVQLELDATKVPEDIATVQSQRPGGVPFVLANPHHVSPATIAALQAWPPHFYRSTNPDLDKYPWQDGTYLGPHGWTNDY